MQNAADQYYLDWEKHFQTTKIIVMFEFLFSFSLIVLGWFWAALRDNSVISGAISLIWGTIILLTIASFILRRVLFTMERLKRLSDQKNLVQGLQINTIFLNLIGVIVAVFGFIIAALSGNKFEIMRAGIISLIIFITNFPRKGVWEGIIQKFEKS